MVFSHKKYFQKSVWLFSMQLFNANATMFLKKILFIFCPWKHKKNQASKVAHNRPQTFFYSTSPATQIIFHIINMSQGPSVSLSVLSKCLRGHSTQQGTYFFIKSLSNMRKNDCKVSPPSIIIYPKYSKHWPYAVAQTTDGKYVQ